jgi:hypothetical protein
MPNFKGVQKKSHLWSSKHLIFFNTSPHLFASRYSCEISTIQSRANMPLHVCYTLSPPSAHAQCFAIKKELERKWTQFMWTLNLVINLLYSKFQIVQSITKPGLACTHVHGVRLRALKFWEHRLKHLRFYNISYVLFILIKY